MSSCNVAALMQGEVYAHGEVYDIPREDVLSQEAGKAELRDTQALAQDPRLAMQGFREEL